MSPADRAEVAAYFSSTLGPKRAPAWGVVLKSLSPAVFVVGACLSAHLCGEREAALKLLREAARAKREGQLPLLLAELFWRAYAETSRVKAVVSRHAFVSTAMMRLVYKCQTESGALPFSHLVWLTRYDSPLLWAMNWGGAGSGAPVRLSSAGIVSHYRLELASGVPIDAPGVGEAVSCIADQCAESPDDFRSVLREAGIPIPGSVGSS